MPQNLFALVRVDNVAQVKRIRLHGDLQAKITDILATQEETFFKGIDEEVNFNGDWKPEKNQLLVLEGLDEIELMTTAVTSNPTAYHAMNLSDADLEPIKALFSGYEHNGDVTVQIQRFNSSQLLARNQIPVIGLQTGNTFTEITDPMFTFGRSLVAVIKGKHLKFKSFSNLRIVFDLSKTYQEATDPDLESFAGHELLQCDNIAVFKDNADSDVRKMVHAITQSEVLTQYDLASINEAAEAFPDVTVSVVEEKIQLPDDKKELKLLLHFLLDDIYEAPLSGRQYQTNSKRIVS